MEPSLATVLDLLKRLPEEFRELRDGVNKALQIAEIDPEMALTRCRKSLDFVVRDTFQRKCGEAAGTRPLENVLQKLVRDGHFPSRLDAYAASIRMLGNVGVHKFDERVTSADVYLSLTQFLPILVWYLETVRSIALGPLVQRPGAHASPDAILGHAHALMAERQWLEAAKCFEEYARHRPEDWGANYSRGVAFANCRGGDETNLNALRAYNEAIAFAPLGTGDARARLFAYRGAICKRLGRLDEAESDLLLARRYAESSHEIDDIHYNLAGVYALRGDRAAMMQMVGELAQSRLYLAVIRAHLGDYFRTFQDDREFLLAIGAD